MIIIMLGAPGSGKGTQAKKLVEFLKIPQISTGELFRRNMREKTPLGIKVDSIIAHGGLVSDDLTIQMLNDRLLDDDCKNGYILDGFPRSIPQAEAFDAQHNVDLVINLDVDEKIIINRTTGRRTCKKCGTMYHIDFIGGEVVCKECGGELGIRSDDTLESVSERLKLYEQITKPLIDYYTNQHKLVNIDANGKPDDIFLSILEAIK